MISFKKIKWLNYFRLGQSEPAPLQHDMDTYKKRLQSFGFNAIVVDGHDIEELCKAFHEAENTKVVKRAIFVETDAKRLSLPTDFSKQDLQGS